VTPIPETRSFAGAEAFGRGALAPAGGMGASSV